LEFRIQRLGIKRLLTKFQILNSKFRGLGRFQLLHRIQHRCLDVARLGVRVLVLERLEEVVGQAGFDNLFDLKGVVDDQRRLFEDGPADDGSRRQDPQLHRGKSRSRRLLPGGG
jgi:hypothetical protein